MSTSSVAIDQNEPADQLTSSQSISNADKYITFKLANYLFALPSEKILKVVATPPPSQGGMVSMGLVQLEQYSIQTLDLPKMMNLQQEGMGFGELSSTKVANALEAPAAAETERATDESKAIATVELEPNPPFLMVLQDAEGELWGIAVHEPPDLMDIPQYALKPVPSEKRLTRALRWISHVVTYDLEGNRHTLLVLDLSRLLSTKPSSSPAEGNRLLEIEPPIGKDISANAEPKGASLLAIEPPLALSELEVEETGRQEEMYA